MLSIHPTTSGEIDYLHLNELLLFDLSGSQLPASSLTVFLSSVLEEPGQGQPGQCIDGGCRTQGCMCAKPAHHMLGNGSTACSPHREPEPAGDNATFCSTNSGGADSNPQMHVAYPCAGGRTSLSKVRVVAPAAPGWPAQSVNLRRTVAALMPTGGGQASELGAAHLPCRHPMQLLRDK